MGFIGWCNVNDMTKLTSIITRNNLAEIAIECKNGEYNYVAVLHEINNCKYQGTYTRKIGGETYRGNVNANLYSVEEGNYLLFGQWMEDDESFTWFVEFDREELEN